MSTLGTRSIGLILAALAALPSAAQTPETKGPVAAPAPQKVDVLRELSTSFEEISATSGRAVVQIFARSYAPAEEGDKGGELLTAQNSSGSGILLTADGYILTNSHVVKGARNLKVQLNQKLSSDARNHGDRSLSRSLPATLIGIDRDTDLAVIKISKTNLPHLVLGNSDELKQGQLVLALGNPLGLENSVSFGIVSAVARQLKPEEPMVYIQTDAPINPGNSGGPLVDAEGHVVGINTFILSQSGGSEGIGFAIPSNIAKQVYQELKTRGHVHRAQLGLVAQTITPQMAEGLGLQLEHGVVVSDVDPEGPAGHAGIKVDDILTAMNGKRLESVRQLEGFLYSQPAGSSLTLRLQRGADQLDLNVETTERTEQFDALADLVDPVNNVVPQLGIVGLDISKKILELMPELRRPAGVVVVARKAGAPYTGRSLETGDVIYAVNRRLVANVADLRESMNSLKTGDAAVLQIERDSKMIYVAIELD